MELDAGFFDVQVALQRVHGGLIGQLEGAPIVGNGRVKVHQIVAVEDDLLHVHFDPAHPQAVEKAVVLAGQSGLGLRVSHSRGES